MATTTGNVAIYQKKTKKKFVSWHLSCLPHTANAGVIYFRS